MRRNKHVDGTLIILALIVVTGFAVRYAVWIYPMYRGQALALYDPDVYTTFGLSYIHAITSMNFTALTDINPGVPPLGMILTGLSAYALGPFMGSSQAGLIAPITASVLTAFPVYIIAKKSASRFSLLAPILIAFDPFLIQYSVAYLDSIGTLFTALSAACIIGSSNRRSMSLAIFFASLAVLTKLSFAIFTVIFALLLLHTKKLTANRALVYLLVPLASLALSPGIWRPGNIEEIVRGHLHRNNLPLAPLLGPFTVDLPQSLPWYVLTYLGMGQVSWSTLPALTPLTLLISTIYVTLTRRLHGLGYAAIPASAMMLTIFLLPRNYWTSSWGGVFTQGVLVRQFYPYYFYPVVALLSVVVVLTVSSDGDRVRSRAITYPPLLLALLSPFAVVMNLGLPYWDFIFLLIYNASKGSWIIEGLIATVTTTLMLVVALVMAELIHRKTRDSQGTVQG